jgi:FdhD protein
VRLAKSPRPTSGHLLPSSTGEGSQQPAPSPARRRVGEGGRTPDEGSCSFSASGTLNGIATTWALPEEVPLAILANSQSYAVMMGTPADLEDFGAGFFLTEGLVAHSSYINNVLALPSGDGVAIDVAVDEKNLLRERMIPRALEGRVGCGLCGIAEMDNAIRMPNDKLKPSPMTVVAIERSFDALPRHQPMNEVNKTVHGAAWCSVDGEILMVREDVGRHNALDKLIGAMARQHINPDQGFVLMSSRCSFELVQKCAMAGISGLATVSAPTALAFKLARQAGLKLVSVSNSGVMVFDGAQNGIV